MSRSAALPGRILMTADTVGGVWTQALDLAGGLARRGVEVVLAVPGPPPSQVQRAAAAAVPGLSLHPLDAPLDWLAATPEAVEDTTRAVAALAAASRVDLVHVNGPALAPQGCCIPVVAGCHSCLATWWRAMRSPAPLPPDFLWRTTLAADGLVRSAVHVAPSAAYAAAAAAAYALPRPPVVVHNGRRAAPTAPAPREAFVLTAGRLWDEAKDISTLDRAAARLPMPVLAAGPTHGPNGATIAPGRLRMLGAIEGGALRGLMARAALFVSTARYEPFGLAVLEAAQAGCPLILSDIASFRELWDGAAVFFESGDDMALADLISGLARDGADRRRLSAAARQRAARYTVEAMTEGWLGAYAAALTGRPWARGEAA
jgi:glycosyltransferase involved in cell wall biosynthesis